MVLQYQPSPESSRPQGRDRGLRGDYGLDFYETIFEAVDADDLNEIAAYGGFPTRYPHWKFGMPYEQLQKGNDYGLGISTRWSSTTIRATPI